LASVLCGIPITWLKNWLLKSKKKVALWAKATSLIPNTDLEGESLGFLVSVIQNNETVPVILVESDTTPSSVRNIDTTRVNNVKLYLERKLQEMMEENPPIEIPLSGDKKQYLYYSRSTILTSLIYYPWVQLGVILIFIAVAYFAFSSSRKAEQNQVWVGLSKETAHQLGTPISSLMAWLEMLKLKNHDKNLVGELDKDVHRLNIIAERFSKIGSPPILKPENLIKVIGNSINYLKTRSSEKIIFHFQPEKHELLVPLNTSLFEWVIENVCKNAMDAIGEQGEIRISISQNSHFVFIDISDTGKGISKSKYKTIFKPGFTTKKRGWGLGLSLTKRIIEEYHKGKIFVAESDIGKGSTIRIILKTA
jgi:signal transduction histidine kinase